MSSLDWYGIGALALIIPMFYFIRKVPAYLTLCMVIAVGFATATFGSVSPQHMSEWIVINCGLLLCLFGLLIVRTMLIRSVSLRLLSQLDSGQEMSIREEIGSRLHDMRHFGLIPTADEGNTLSSFGRLVSTTVAVVYALVRIKN